MAHRITSDFALESDLTLKERRIVAKRAELRAALRKEYLAKFTNPHIEPSEYLYSTFVLEFTQRTLGLATRKSLDH